MNKPKPTIVKELSGAFKKNPQRRPKGEPIPTGGIGEPLLTLTPAEKVIWDEIVAITCPGVLTNADRLGLEMLCKLIHEMRTSFEYMNAAKLSRLTYLLGEFGLTPAARAKIVVPQAEKKNGFSDL